MTSLRVDCPEAVHAESQLLAGDCQLAMNADSSLSVSQRPSGRTSMR